MPVVERSSHKVIQPLPGPAPTESGRGAVFKKILGAAARVAAAAVPGAGPVLGTIIDQLGRRKSPLLDSFGGTSETLQYLKLQREIQQETRTYEATSNVLKARHEATMSAIRNMKS